MLKLTNITIPHRLNAINAEADAGKLIHLVGPNGAGKSTLLAVMAGLMTHQGNLTLCGKPLSAYSALTLARLRAYLPQQQESHAMMAVFQYIALHQPRFAPQEAIEKTVTFLAEQLSILDKLASPLTALSGGEWQRVRLAAAFLQVWPTVNPDAQMILLDEPMNSLDVAQQHALDRLLTCFCQQGRTAIVSAHHLNHTLHHADSVWLLHQGNLIESGLTDNVMTPAILARVFNIDFELFQFDSQKWLRSTSQKENTNN